QKGNFEWGQFWVIFALVGWTIAALVGVGFVGPELGRIDEAARMHGPDSPEVAMRVKRLFMIFRFDTVLLLLIVVNMAAKPSFCPGRNAAPVFHRAASGTSSAQTAALKAPLRLRCAHLATPLRAAGARRRRAKRASWAQPCARHRRRPRAARPCRWRPGEGPAT